MRELIAGVDLGGTNVRIALSDKQSPGTFLEHLTRKTPVTGGPAAFIEVVKEGLAVCLKMQADEPFELTGLGCTIPGITDAEQGQALLVTNLPGWDNYPIRSALESALNIPVAIDNDVNAAALGEFWFGQGRGCHSVIYLTISTGVAAGIVVNGQLLRGVNHAAGEMGFFVPDPLLLEDNWEPNGCLELTSAGVGIAERWVKKKNGSISQNTTELQHVTAENVFKAAAKGDIEAIEVTRKAADYLAQSVIALATVIDPECIVLSGSIVQHQQHVYNHICQAVKRHVPHAPKIVISEFDGDAPLIGAMALISKKLAG
ncbi:MAG: ROK family protein [Rhodothermales bacterium]